MTRDVYRHRRRTLILIIALFGVLLALLVIATVFGPGFDPDSNDRIWSWTLGILMAMAMGVFVYVLWKNPPAVIIDEIGVNIPATLKRPIRWDEIHRIRRHRARRNFGRVDWLIIDLSPGLLAPLRLPTWRRLELWLQKQQGVRIPLHGLEADPEDVVRSIERFRPVVDEDD